MNNKNSVIGNEPTEKKDDSIELKKLIVVYEHVKVCATSRKSRCEDLMQRRGSHKWDASKKQKMVRRLTTANQELQQCESALIELAERLQRVEVAA